MKRILRQSIAMTLAVGIVALSSANGIAATPNDTSGQFSFGHGGPDRGDLRDIQTIVVIYAENRSFDNLFGTYPGANGLRNASPASSTQLDRDGTVMSGLPAVWGGTSAGVTEIGRASCRERV